MKMISNIILSAVCLTGMSVSAQQMQPEIGFLRMVHSVAHGTGRATMWVDGENIFPQGYELGQRTGGLGLKAGSHKITIKKDGVEAGTTQITLKAGETLTLIGFSEKQHPAHDGAPPVWKIRILRLKQSEPERGFRMSLVSVCDQDEVEIQAAIQGKNAVDRITVKKLSLTLVDLGRTRGEVLIKQGNTMVTTVSPEDQGNYVVVLYQNQQGKIMALTFFDPKFVVAG